MDSKKIIASQIKPVEEVREIKSEEEMKLETPKVEKVEVVKETSSPSENMTDEEKEFEENMKKTMGTTVEATDAECPPLGAAETVVLGAGGAITEGAGKLAGDEGTEAAERVAKESVKKPLKDVKEGTKELGEKIKETFE